MSSLRLTSVSEVTDLPQYPVPAGERLESHSYFKLHHTDFLESDFFGACKEVDDWEVIGLALALWSKSQYQDPVGTIPSEPFRQARMMGIPLLRWEDYLRRKTSPLHGWTRCRIIGTGEIRLMNKTVTEVTLDALNWKNKDRDRKSADQERQALARLRKSVEEIGSRNLASDRRYIVMLHRWLLDNYPHGYRTPVRILEGMEHLGTSDFRR